MADTNVSPQAAGQAANPFQQAPAAPGQQPAAQTAGEQGQEHQYLTRQEAEDLRKAILREAQSLVDKSGSRIEKKVTEFREQLGQLTPEQESTLRAKLAKETPEPSPEPVTPSPAQGAAHQEPTAQIDPHIQQAAVIMAKPGNVVIYENDPEFEKIKPYIATGAVTEPEKFYPALTEAMRTKAAREAAKMNPNSRIPLGGQQPAGRPALSPHDKLVKGLATQ